MLLHPTRGIEDKANTKGPRMRCKGNADADGCGEGGKVDVKAQVESTVAEDGSQGEGYSQHDKRYRETEEAAEKGKQIDIEEGN